MNPTTKETTEAPAIAALPTPSTEEVLSAKLTETEAKLAKAQKLADNVMEENSRLSERLKAFQENAFSFALAHIDGGQVLMDAGEQFKDFSKAVKDRESAGKFAIIITAKPFKPGVVTVSGEIQSKPPKEGATPSVFFVNDDGELTKNDPRQKQFKFSNPDRSDPEDPEPYADEEI